MTPAHHPPPDLLRGYAVGDLSASVELFVATHLVYCPACRAEVAALEALAGEALAAAPVTVGATPRAVVWPPPAPPPAPVAGRAPPRSDLADLPRLVTDLIPSNAAWTGWAPGFREIELPLGDGPPARIVRINPGKTMPLHTHEGFERTLVMRGELTDSAVLRRGDAAVHDERVTHIHRVTSADACVCLVVNDAWLVHRSWSGRLFRWVSERLSR